MASVTGNSMPVKTDNDVYEQQLTQLQEQLISAMIENEQIKIELDELKKKNKVEMLLHDLEYEREKNAQLCNELRKQTDRVGSPTDVAQKTGECSNTMTSSEKSVLVKLRDYLVEFYLELLTDLTEESDSVDTKDQEADQLTVKQLKDNIKRFKNGIMPIIEFFQNVWSLVNWHSPPFTLFILILYMYSAWHGWLLPLILFLCIIQLSINYLGSRGWQINFGIFFRLCDDNKESVYPELALSDKFNLVLQVARQVQNLLGQLADGLEKIKNLLMWRYMEATKQLFIMLMIAFLLSCIMDGVNLFQLFALYMGIKMFIIEYIYNQFPRIKQRHDSVYRLWQQLPNDEMLQRQYKYSLIGSQIIGTGDSATTRDGRYDSVEISDSEKIFCTTFTLPLSERPLSGWEGGWRVTLVDKDKPLIKAFSRSGRLFLTNSFLCLERYKAPSPKNIMIPLTNITHIEKAKPYTWLPGNGMSIQISVVGYEVPYTFGAIINRDDCFNKIVEHGAKLRLAWALEHVSAATLPDDVNRAKTASEPGVRDSTPPGSASSERSFRMSDLRDLVDDDMVLLSN